MKEVLTLVILWDCEPNGDWYMNVYNIKPNISILYSIIKHGSSLAWLELLGMASTNDPRVPSRLAASWKHSLDFSCPTAPAHTEITAYSLSASNRQKKRGRNNPEVRTTDPVSQIRLTGHCLDTSNSESSSLQTISLRTIYQIYHMKEKSKLINSGKPSYP